ncbi:ATP-binding cassette domain-containing protein (plasmid) [Mesorhizobium sp. ORM8.1]
MNDQDKQGRGADAETNPRVVVEHLTVRIQATGAEVVRDVSLTLTTGEILGIVGESGSGKTTLGLAMIGHTRRGLEVASGRVSVNGMAITGLSAKAMVKLRGNVLAYVPQDPGTALNPARRIGSQMREALPPTDEPLVRRMNASCRCWARSGCHL